MNHRTIHKIIRVKICALKRRWDVFFFSRCFSALNWTETGWIEPKINVADRRKREHIDQEPTREGKAITLDRVLLPSIGILDFRSETSEKKKPSHSVKFILIYLFVLRFLRRQRQTQFFNFDDDANTQRLAQANTRDSQRFSTFVWIFRFRSLSCFLASLAFSIFSFTLSVVWSFSMFIPFVCRRFSLFSSSVPYFHLLKIVKSEKLI